MKLLGEAVASDQLVVAIDPGKVESRVWVSTGERGLVSEPESLPTSRVGLARLAELVDQGGGAPLIALEQTGALHRAWQVALEQRWPNSLRVFAPSETQAARAQLSSRRMKTDDRDCAALTWLVRQGAGRRALPSPVDSLQAAVRHRRQLVDARRVLRQRLHDQLNALCPGLSAPAGHGRELPLHSPTGLAVLACAAAFEGRPASARSLKARASGRLTDRVAGFWVSGGRRCYHLQQTPTHVLFASGETWSAYAPCRSTSPSSRARSRTCLIRAPAGCCSRYQGSRRSAPPPSPRSRCRSSAFAPPSISTPPPASRQPPTSPRR